VGLDLDWTTRSKQDYYLAQIAFEMRLLRLCWTGGGDGYLSMEELLLDFKEATVKEGEDGEEVVKEYRRKGKARPIEVGKDELDDHWKRVDANAKAMWASRLGVQTLTSGTLDGGSGTSSPGHPVRPDPGGRQRLPEDHRPGHRQNPPGRRRPQQPGG
jgi:hypothetical protein